MDIIDLTSPKKGKKDASTIMRMMVLEDKYGVCLWDKVWNWSKQESCVMGSKLVFAFFQISSSLREGDKEEGTVDEVKQAIFSPPESVSSRRRRSRGQKSNKVRLVTIRQGGIIVALFHQPFVRPEDNVKLDALLNKILASSCKEFSRQCGPKCLLMAQTFKDYAEERLDIPETQIMKEFSDYKMDWDKTFKPVTDLVSATEKKPKKTDRDPLVQSS